jgi:hypothetical protein
MKIARRQEHILSRISNRRRQRKKTANLGVLMTSSSSIYIRWQFSKTQLLNKLFNQTMSPQTLKQRRRRSPSHSLRTSLLEHNFEQQAFGYINMYSVSRHEQSQRMDTSKIDAAIERFYQAYSKKLIENGCRSWDKVVCIMH